MKPHVLVLFAGLTGCDALLDFDRLRNGHGDGGSSSKNDAGTAACVPGQTPTFATDLDEHPADGPSSLAVGDVDGDGDLDVVFGSYSQLVYVMKNGGARTFDQATSFPLGCSQGYNHVLLLADFDGDGAKDLVVACDGMGGGGTASEVFFMRNDGSGVFGSAVRFTNPTANPRAGAVADLDHDGKPDAVLVNYDTGGVDIFWGSDTFTTQMPTHVSTGMSPSSVSAASLANDTLFDLVVANESGTYQIARQDRTSPRTFTVAATDIIPAGGGSPFGAAIGHLDEGLVPDLVGIESGTNLYSSLGTASGSGVTTFGKPVPNVGTPLHPNVLALGDLNCDGRDDAALTHFQLDSDTTQFDRFEIFESSSTGQLTNVFAHDVEMMGAPISSDTLIADLDGDGIGDVLVTSLATDDTKMGSVRILWGLPSQTP